MFQTAINHRFEKAVSNLMAPPRGLDFDYSKPEGEAALVPPTSVSWRIFKNPVSLFIGGVAAVILELGEPSVDREFGITAPLKRTLPQDFEELVQRR